MNDVNRLPGSSLSREIMAGSGCWCPRAVWELLPCTKSFCSRQPREATGSACGSIVLMCTAAFCCRRVNFGASGVAKSLPGLWLLGGLWWLPVRGVQMLFLAGNCWEAPVGIASLYLGLGIEFL